ncbi:MAG: hypothetical protein NTU44_00920 [Bacteroidetes bacterium]|nr:hypothetical protein [Bacteroidota bacterium]
MNASLANATVRISQSLKKIDPQIEISGSEEKRGLTLKLKDFIPSVHLEEITAGHSVTFFGMDYAFRNWRVFAGSRQAAIFNGMVININRSNPFRKSKMALYRAIGLKIGKNVTISPGIVFDYYLPELITIEDGCLIGEGCKIATHLFDHSTIFPGTRTFQIGTTVIGRNSLVGAYSIIIQSHLPPDSHVRINRVIFHNYE